jgi:uncharacterized membrane protein YgcG
MTPVRILVLLAVVLALGIGPAVAQPVTSAKSGVVAYLEGKVFLENERLEFSTVHFPQIKESGTLRTEDGRAEVLLTPGVVLRLGENSALKMITNRLIDTRLELLSGSAVVEADVVEKDTAVTIVCKNGTVGLSKIGIYRFDAEPGRLRVFKGLADVKLGSDTVEATLVTGGKMMSLSGDTATVEKFDVEDTDALDRWSSHRGMVLAMANPSSAKTASSRPTFNVGIGPGMGMGMGMGMCNTWVWNPWYGVYTYVPCNGMFYSPYGYQYWSPYTIGRVYNNPYGYGNRGGGLNNGLGGLRPPGTTGSVPYNAATASPMGNSGIVNSSPGMSSAPSSSMGTTSSAAAGSSSAGHGSSGGASSGGGHGH